ncbi:MAG: regulatory protein [Roseivirga sp.]|jgi:regulatory protein
MNSQKSYTVEQAKRALERYCVYQDRCHKEVISKLYDCNMIPETHDIIIVHLIQHDFLNEERFSKSYARGKFRIKKWGKVRIVRELKFRNISAYNVKTALKEIEESDYFNTFNTLALKKFDSITESNPYKKKKKLADYLLYRGWESDLVYKKVSELIK